MSATVFYHGGTVVALGFYGFGFATCALVATSRFDCLTFFLGNDKNDFLLDYLTFFRRLMSSDVTGIITNC